MRSSHVLEWIWVAALPVALVWGSAWLRIPQWLRGAFGRRQQVPAPENAERQPEPVPAGPEVLLDDVPAPVEMSLIDEMLSQSRYALLLRPQIVVNLSPDEVERTRSALAEGMCLVPAGDVLLESVLDDEESDARNLPRAIPLRLDAYYLDRFPVTNAQYQQFVAAGGYEQMAIWDQEILAAVLDFVDRTGHPGPRYWEEGHFPAGEGNHPVVGICWYEAWAFARWAGKRLSTDAEWVKAGSWPVAFAGHLPLARRYPWGDAMDPQRANLWSSGWGRTVAVDEFPGGVSVGGVHQLIGNVWEWTADSFVIDRDRDPEAARQHKLKSIHGGAFDTYLDTQATCQFKSGDHALARKHNIGFRCAIGMCDFVNPHSSELVEVPEETPELATEHAEALR